ncbi:MAG: gamma carbonic anhydrase family protein [Tepidisphaeraceae bacterium]|jgi:carbonic anhydrase/acetyltransferase-like protein (isoleucine patch superfamily)
MSRFVRTPAGYFRPENCTIVGDVRIGADSSIWFGAVIRGDVAPIRIGTRVNIQDNAVVHCDTAVPNTIEDDVTVGHGAIVHGKHVGSGSLIGMGATLLSRTVVGRQCLIAAGALVPPDLNVPDRMLVLGVPGKIVRPVSEEELRYMQWLTQTYRELAQKYADGMFDA